MQFPVFTETTKTRLTELEATKKELAEKLLLEQACEVFIPSSDDLEKHFALALENIPQSLVDLLLDKAALGNGRLELYLKHPGKPTDNPDLYPDNNDNPDGTKISCRGCLFYIYKYLSGHDKRILFLIASFPSISTYNL